MRDLQMWNTADIKAAKTLNAILFLYRVWFRPFLYFKMENDLKFLYKLEER